MKLRLKKKVKTLKIFLFYFQLTILILLAQNSIYVIGQFEKSYVEVRQLLDKMREISIQKQGAFSDSEVQKMAKIKPIYVNDGTEVSANQKISDSLFENDILLSLSQARVLLDEIKNFSQSKIRKRPKRQALLNPTLLWSTNKIPYVLSYTDSNWQELIRAAMNHIEKNTCIRFKAANLHNLPPDYIEFNRGSGCWSSVGRTGGQQTISIGYGCESLGIVAHEILHALGLWHEQSRYDRDDFITINYKYIASSTLRNFEKRSIKNTLNYDQPYDLGSVMHYGSRSFVIDYNEYSILSKDPNYQKTMGQRAEISFKDAKMINIRYCSTTCSNKLSCYQNGYTDPNNCNICKCPDGYSGTFCEKIPESNVKQCRGGEYIAISTLLALQSPFVTRRIKCYYRIKAQKQQKIEITFLTINFPCNDACESYVELKHLNNKIMTGARFCCNVPDLKIISEGSEVVLIFKGADKPNLNGSHKGFLIHFRAVSETGNVIANTPITHQLPITKTTITKTITKITTQKSTTHNFGVWSNWAAWSSCTASCGGCGVRKRIRACYNGLCYGSVAETEACNTKRCPIPSTTTRCIGRLLMPCDLLNMLDFGTIIKKIAIFDNKTKYSTQKKERSKRSNDNYVLKNINEKIIKKKNFETKKLLQILEIKKNKPIITKFKSVINRIRRFVDGSKQINQKIYCEKLFSYNCPTSLLTISMDWSHTQDSKTRDERLCCKGYYYNGNECILNE